MEIEDNYENIQNKNKNKNTLGPQTWSQNRAKAHHSRRRKLFVPVTVCLGLICVLLVIILLLLYLKLTAERDQIKMTYMNIAEEYNKTLNSLQVNYSHLSNERDHLQNLNLELKARVQNLSDANVKSITESCRYFVSTERKSWTDSRQFCKDRGGDLVIINTEEEQRYISSVVKERAWIGLSDIEQEGKMKWVDNTLPNKGFWYEGEPNDQNGNEDCVEIWISKHPLNNWNDLPCSDMRKWVCEN